VPPVKAVRLLRLPFVFTAPLAVELVPSTTRRRGTLAQVADQRERHHAVATVCAVGDSMPVKALVVALAKVQGHA
jgi:hypothetical protein